MITHSHTCTYLSTHTHTLTHTHTHTHAHTRTHTQTQRHTHTQFDFPHMDFDPRPLELLCCNTLCNFKTTDVCLAKQTNASLNVDIVKYINCTVGKLLVAYRYVPRYIGTLGTWWKVRNILDLKCVSKLYAVIVKCDQYF